MIRFIAACIVTVLAVLMIQDPSTLDETENRLLVKAKSVIEEVRTESDDLSPENSIVIDSDTTAEGGVAWVYDKVTDGEAGYQLEYYEYNYDELGNLISVTLQTDQTEIYEATEAVYSNGQVVQPGAYFRSRLATAYGVDCELCNGKETGVGHFGSGIYASTTQVQQPNGEWLDGITYDGYYIIATSTLIPLCTVVEISDHSYYGSGIEAGEPFLAIVLDRGVTGSAIDLFAGGESTSEIRNGKNRTPLVTIKYMGTFGINEYGRKGCIIDYGEEKDTVE